MIHIVVALTKDYYQKSIPFFKSLEHNANCRVSIVAVGFHEYYDGCENIEVFHMPIELVQTRKNNFPSNRPKYICLESGEFLDFIRYDNGDIIVNPDADMIMQRPFTSEEIQMLENFEHGDIGMTYGNNPQVTMLEDINNIKPILSIPEINKLFTGNWSNKSAMTAGVVVARASTWKAIRELYVSSFDNMTKCFDHHAGGQWLLNWIANEKLKFVHLPESFHNGDWFNNKDTYEEDGYLFMNDGTMILFNHTKYNKEYRYGI
jgi:hypothetical protein